VYILFSFNAQVSGFHPSVYASPDKKKISSENGEYFNMMTIPSSSIYGQAYAERYGKQSNRASRSGSLSGVRFQGTHGNDKPGQLKFRSSDSQPEEGFLTRITKPIIEFFKSILNNFTKLLGRKDSGVNPTGVSPKPTVMDRHMALLRHEIERIADAPAMKDAMELIGQQLESEVPGLGLPSEHQNIILLEAKKMQTSQGRQELLAQALTAGVQTGELATQFYNLLAQLGQQIHDKDKVGIVNSFSLEPIVQENPERNEHRVSGFGLSPIVTEEDSGYLSDDERSDGTELEIDEGPTLLTSQSQTQSPDLQGQKTKKKSSRSSE
jgi:hypothetical protein